MAKVGQFRVFALIQTGQLGLQCHTALRAAALLILPDFRVHRTSEYCAFGDWHYRSGGLGRISRQILQGTGGELALTPGAAKVIQLCLMFVKVVRLR